MLAVDKCQRLLCPNFYDATCAKCHKNYCEDCIKRVKHRCDDVISIEQTNEAESGKL